MRVRVQLQRAVLLVAALAPFALATSVFAQATPPLPPIPEAPRYAVPAGGTAPSAAELPPVPPAPPGSGVTAEPLPEHVAPPTYQVAAPPPVAHVEEVDGGLRVLAEIVGWGIGYGSTIGLVFLALDADADFGLMITGVILDFFVLTPLLTWGAGTLAGGRGSLAWTIVGNAILSVFGAIAAYEITHASAVSAATAGPYPVAQPLSFGTSRGSAIPLGSARFAF